MDIWISLPGVGSKSLFSDHKLGENYWVPSH